jgi:hypothetical protein
MSRGLLARISIRVGAVLARVLAVVAAVLVAVAVVLAVYLWFSATVYWADTAWMGATEQSWALFGVPHTPVHAGWQGVVRAFLGAVAFGLAVAILSIPVASFGRRGAAVFYAALLVAAALLLSNRYQVVQTRGGETARLDRLTGDLVLLESGRSLRDVNRTITLRFLKSKVVLKTYWGNGKVHYHVRLNCTGEQLKDAVARSVYKKGGRVRGVEFTLTNRFREPVTAFEVSPEQFERDLKDEKGMQVACGSVPLSRDEYEEFAATEQAYLRDNLAPWPEG